MIWTNLRTIPTRITQPAVNTFEREDSFVLELALPGWQKSDVTLEVDGDLLVVKGERNTDDAPQYRRQEFGLKQFEKSFHLPETVDIDTIGAAMEQGVLSITLPKLPEAQPVRKLIEVA